MNAMLPKFWERTKRGILIEKVISFIESIDKSYIWKLTVTKVKSKSNIKNVYSYKECLEIYVKNKNHPIY